MSSKLTVSVLLSELSEVVDWELFGHHLSIPSHELRKIHKQFFHEGVERCKAEMFDFLIENPRENQPDPDWRLIADALDKMKGLKDMNELSQKIRKTFLGEEIMTEATPSTPSTLSNQTTTSSNVPIKVEKNVVRIFSDLESKFAKLVTDIKSSIQTKNVPLSDLHYYIKQRLDQRDLPLPQTLEGLFDNIWPFYDFLNTCLLENISNEFLHDDPKIQSSLQKYTEELDSFKSSTKMEELVNNMTSTDVARKGTEAVVLKLEGKCWLEVTLKRFQQLVEEIFSEKSYNLCHMKVKRGCICVSWIVPTYMVPSLLSVAKERSEFISNVGILKLEVGDQIVLDQVEESFSSFSVYMFRAVRQVNLDVVCFLLSMDIDPNITDEQGKTPLIEACLSIEDHSSCLAVAKALVKANANVNSIDYTGQTALLLAVSGQHREVAKLLIENKADPNVHPVNHSCLRIATELDDQELVTCLLEAGAYVDVQNTDDEFTPLLLACRRGATPLVDALLKYKADPNFRGKNGWTGLMLASAYFHLEVVELLIIAGANVNATDDYGWTALMVAINCNDLNIVNHLLQAGADPSAGTTTNHYTAMHLACRLPEASILLSLLEVGADPNSATKFGVTPLHVACEYGSEFVVEVLLNLNVRVNAKTTSNRSPLTAAISSNSINIIQMLISAGAKPCSLDVDLSLQFGNPEITQLLLVHADDSDIDVSSPSTTSVNPVKYIHEEEEPMIPYLALKYAIEHPQQAERNSPASRPAARGQ